VIQGFSLAIYIRIHHQFSIFLWVLASGLRTVATRGPFI